MFMCLYTWMQEQDFRVIIDSDEESDGGLSCLLVKKETGNINSYTINLLASSVCNYPIPKGMHFSNFVKTVVYLHVYVQ